MIYDVFVMDFARAFSAHPVLVEISDLELFLAIVVDCVIVRFHGS